MDRDQMIEIAKEAGIKADWIPKIPQLPDFLESFARLIAAAEREACIEIILRETTGSAREDVNCYEAVEKIRKRQ